MNFLQNQMTLICFIDSMVHVRIEKHFASLLLSVLTNLLHWPEGQVNGLRAMRCWLYLRWSPVRWSQMLQAVLKAKCRDGDPVSCCLSFIHISQQHTEGTHNTCRDLLLRFSLFLLHWGSWASCCHRREEGKGGSDSHFSRWEQDEGRKQSFGPCIACIATKVWASFLVLYVTETQTPSQALLTANFLSALSDPVWSLVGIFSAVCSRGMRMSFALYKVITVLSMLISTQACLGQRLQAPCFSLFKPAKPI